MRFSLVPFVLLLAVAVIVQPGAATDAGASEKAARKLFAAKKKPSDLRARSIGFYTRGCMAGGTMLPVDGPAWQAMRLSRNRNWGHPDLVDLVQRLAVESKEKDGWPGLLVGDLAQPRGGPMLTGHRSHQIGLDADIWLMPMPDRTLSRQEREKISAISMIKSQTEINEKHWRPGHVKLLKRAAEYEKVERIFVHPAIKKALCEAAGPKAKWLYKIRPFWGHHYHFHIRINCPPGSPNCKNQKPVEADTGCGKQLDDWFALLTRPKKKPKPGAKPKKRREVVMADLPRECRAVLAASDASPEAFAAPPPPVVRASVTPAAPVRKPVPARAAPMVAAPVVPLPSRRPDASAAAPPQAAAPAASSGSALPWLRGLATPPLPDRKPN